MQQIPFNLYVKCLRNDYKTFEKKQQKKKQKQKKQKKKHV